MWTAISGAEGLWLAERIGKSGKKRAIIAVARKLAVLLHPLWVSGEVYEPLNTAAEPPWWRPHKNKIVPGREPTKLKPSSRDGVNRLARVPLQK